MCAIVGSFDRDKFEELIELNTYRGNHSFSLAEYDINNAKINLIEQSFGYFDYSLLDNITTGNYIIGHVQAPTTDSKDKESIHPSIIDNTYLWHNGIIKENCIEEIQTVLSSKIKWDTKLLHKYILEDKNLSNIDGTFSCLYSNGSGLYLFRNEISPMFIDNKFNISSTKFEESTSTHANNLFIIDFHNFELITKKEFLTKENPYFFG